MAEEEETEEPDPSAVADALDELEEPDSSAAADALDELDEPDPSAVADALDELESGDPLAAEMLQTMEEGDGDSGEPALAGGKLQAMEDGGGMGTVLGADGISDSVARLMEVPLTVTIELGRTRMVLEDVMQLGEQGIVDLDKTVGEPVEIMVNGKLFARGEVVTVGENFGVRIVELVTPVTSL